MLFLAMLFFHIWDDYGRQGILASLKQKQWWREQKEYNEKYKNDWIAALLCHSLSWSIMIHIPVFIYLFFFGALTQPAVIYSIILIIFNCGVHAYIDDLKCNKYKINLIQDQCLHIIQILFTLRIMTLFL